MNDITYGIICETYSLGNTSRISYGIAVYSHAEQDGTASVISAIHDISSDKERIEDLVYLCNHHNLALEHFCEVIDDFLAS